VKVIGAGFGRTGTWSLMAALGVLEDLSHVVARAEAEFLGVPEPEEPFPRLNDAAQMRRGIRAVKTIVTALPVALVLSIAATLVLLRRYA
jgi:hypothetical protein